MSPRKAAALVACIYVVMGVVWIRFSDQALYAIAADSALLTELQTFKGWAYVGVTGILLFFLVHLALIRERSLSERDSLTQLLNRHMFRRELEAELQFAEEHDQPLALILLNLDGFKQINNNVGLKAGDEYLQDVANVLRETFTQHCIIGRFDGDEFGVALPSALWPDTVIPAVEQLQQRIRAIEVKERPNLSLTTCVGISLFPRDGKTIQPLIDAATLALDEAKSAGPNQQRTYKSTYGEFANQRSRLLLDLKAALANDQLSVVYQPQFDASKHTVTGVEVLVRWQHPQQGFISPDQFIQIAEQNGLITEITDFVMRQAIGELNDHGLLYHDVTRVSFNVSAADFIGERSRERFARNLSQLPGDWSIVQLELTETAALLNLDSVRRVLQSLRERGVQVSLDDFGTGYSSLSTLRQLPIQELKIDQSFVRDIATNMNDAKLVRTILAMAKALHMRVVAEGVETSAQASFLIHEGCHELQGYLYAKPMGIMQLATFLRNLRSSKLQT
ncbi:hypothetical protein CWE22_01005 [Pseudidiomarina aestuarii]|uniref:GGDEF-domain containing protein n=1 Tax=Pseudidiomarina aestuarii TaxID=624146 RepID=A0A7Z7ET76_9GAMM|nr:bifunctional diguanylate cyclase/phosphodiesterase [Pseudidiomarina aestuarii]RUO40808.1 hypothetical protein CWE22_01005 [Pseudidiomarina aestuarii]